MVLEKCLIGEKVEDIYEIFILYKVRSENERLWIGFICVFPGPRCRTDDIL